MSRVFVNRSVQCACLLLPVVCMSTVFAADNWQEPAKVAGFPFSMNMDARHKVIVSAKQGKAVAQLANGGKQVLADLPEKEVAAFADHVALQADFNFDGLGDLALFEATGYGGVNQFYRLFLGTKNGKFTAFNPSVSNPLLAVQQQALRSSARSGPRWYESTFQFKQGKLSQRIETVMIDDELSHMQFFNAAGKLLGAIVTADPETASLQSKPVSRTVIVDKLALYNKPDEASKTKMYVIAGDKVELLNYRQDESWTDWYLMRFKGSRVVEKWVKAEGLGK